MGECAIELCMRLSGMKSSRVPKCADDEPTLLSWKLLYDMAGGLAAIGLVTRCNEANSPQPWPVPVTGFVILFWLNTEEAVLLIPFPQYDRGSKLRLAWKLFMLIDGFCSTC